MLAEAISTFLRVSPERKLPQEINIEMKGGISLRTRRFVQNLIHIINNPHAISRRAGNSNNTTYLTTYILHLHFQMVNAASSDTRQDCVYLPRPILPKSSSLQSLFQWSSRMCRHRQGSGDCGSGLGAQFVDCHRGFGSFPCLRHQGGLSHVAWGLRIPLKMTVLRLRVHRPNMPERFHVALEVEEELKGRYEKSKLYFGPLCIVVKISDGRVPPFPAG